MKKMILGLLIVTASAAAHATCELTKENIEACITARVANGEETEVVKASIIEAINAQEAANELSAESAQEARAIVAAFGA